MNKRPFKKKKIFDLIKKISLKNLGFEEINLSESEDRFLHKDIKSNINLPPFNNSAVDGYALHKDSLIKNIELKNSFKIVAGDFKKIYLTKNNAARIFTGAYMPINSKTVVMQENVKIKNKNFFLINRIPKYGENCRIKGEDIKKGKVILKSGDKVNSSNINLIAAIGKKTIKVKKKLRVGYFTSGNELIEPSEKLKSSLIYNSNRYSLNSLLKKNYINSQYLGILKDKEKHVREKILSNSKKYDVIITTGGASVGEEDHLINVLKKNGKIFFWKTAIKPGRPLAIGKIKETIIICLPGNPVSVHLLYGMIIKPFFEYLCSSKLILPISIKAVSNFEMIKKTERLEWLRVNIDKKRSDQIYVDKFNKQGSGMISSIAYSDGILEIPEKISKIKKGDKFDFYLFDNLFN